ncbi:MAG: ABC transporter ATP-binding protein [Rickettsiaceae bacterium]
MSNAALTLKNVNKTYTQGKSTVNVLKNLNLCVDYGEFVSIIGKSGSGKSTLLHIAGLLDSSDSGDVILNSIICNDSKVANKTRDLMRLSNIGFIHQRHYLLHDFSVQENAMIPMILNGISKEEAEDKAYDLLRMLELDGRIYSKTSELSGGQQQRVAIARAIANNPKIILADEPTGNLDPPTSSKVFKLFMNIMQKYNTAIVMVTHNHDLAFQMSTSYELIDGSLQTVKTGN